jgi:hypothetical protein
VFIYGSSKVTNNIMEQISVCNGSPVITSNTITGTLSRESNYALGITADYNYHGITEDPNYHGTIGSPIISNNTILGSLTLAPTKSLTKISGNTINIKHYIA